MNKESELIKALIAAKEVINHLGDILNSMDAIEQEDTEYVNPRIELIDEVLKETHKS